MSKRYPGGLITKTPVTPSGPYENSTASGVWTLEQQLQFKQQGIWPTAGLTPNYIEDVFSTYLYTGNGSTQTITNSINLSTNGGLVWIKARTDTSGGATSHALVDTVRGSSKWLSSNAASSEATNANLVTGFTTSGFSVGTAPYWANENSIPYVSWTFREQPKFFDIVTYTGNATATLTGFQVLNHALGSAPGCMIVKATSASAGSDWYVWHRTQVGKYSNLNYTSGFTTDPRFFNNTSPTSTTFTVGDSVSGGGGYGLPYGYGTNENGVTYVAYLFAHDAGGFGLTGTDNVISCGSYTTDGSGTATVNLGYEPQFVLEKSTGTSSWWIADTMRGMSETNTIRIFPNQSAPESSVGSAYIVPKATGFDVVSHAGSTTYIYIAIRRGPMKVPTVGTNVFSPVAYTGTAANQTITSGFAPDMVQFDIRGSDNGYQKGFADKLRNAWSIPTNTDAEYGPLSTGNVLPIFNNTGFVVGSGNNANGSGSTYVSYAFQRAPSFFDEVCYTGTGSATTVTHNLGVVPELMIVKTRSNIGQWSVYASPTGAAKVGQLQDTIEFQVDTNWNLVAPTSSVFSISCGSNVSSYTYVAYLFATCAGVSKVGSYTGTGALQTVNCGFTSGARFVLIKRTNSTGGWYVWDSARGITSGNDPYLFLNSTAAEVTSTNYVDTDTTGFKVTAAAPAGLNASGGTYIFLAIA